MKLINKVANSAELHGYLLGKLESFEKSHSTFTNNRLEKWLFYRPIKLSLPEVTAVEDRIDYRLLKLAIKINRELNIGLVTYNGKGSDGKIKLHRDATYCQHDAYLINIGEATFNFEGKLIQLVNGGIYQFNCKKEHGIEWAGNDRFGIIFWKLKQKITMTKY